MVSAAAAARDDDGDAGDDIMVWHGKRKEGRHELEIDNKLMCECYYCNLTAFKCVLTR